MNCVHRGKIAARGSHHQPIFACPHKAFCVLNNDGIIGNDGKPIQVCGADCSEFEAVVPMGIAPSLAKTMFAREGNRPRKFAFFTGTSFSNQGKRIETMIKSARSVGVTADFHLFAPSAVDGAIFHQFAGDWKFHMAKIDFLLRLKEVDAEYFVWLDTDNYFVRDPGDLSELIRDEPCWVSMESEFSDPRARYKEWYGIFYKEVANKPRPNDILFPMAQHIWKEFGAKRLYNTNGGMFIVRRDAIDEFHKRAWDVFNRLVSIGFRNSRNEPPPDEPALAIVGDAMVSDPVRNTFEYHKHAWLPDWNHAWSDDFRKYPHTKNQLPDGTEWEHWDWLTGQPLGFVNPAIIHLMRGKTLMDGLPVRMPQQVVKVRRTPIVFKELVGDQLAKIFADCGVKRPENCDCNRWIRLMNQGIEWCAEHREEVKAHLRDASKEAGWLGMAKVAARGYLSIDSLIDSAMKMATIQYAESHPQVAEPVAAQT